PAGGRFSRRSANRSAIRKRPSFASRAMASQTSSRVAVPDGGSASRSTANLTAPAPRSVARPPAHRPVLARRAPLREPPPTRAALARARHLEQRRDRALGFPARDPRHPGKVLDARRPVRAEVGLGKAGGHQAELHRRAAREGVRLPHGAKRTLRASWSHSPD